MLANFLPGLREIRTPLALGYLFLIAGWVAFAEVLELAWQQSALLHSLGQIEGLGGSGVAVSASTFTAYLVGVTGQGAVTVLSSIILAPALAVISYVLGFFREISDWRRGISAVDRAAPGSSPDVAAVSLDLSWVGHRRFRW